MKTFRLLPNLTLLLLLKLLFLLLLLKTNSGLHTFTQWTDRKDANCATGRQINAPWCFSEGAVSITGTMFRFEAEFIKLVPANSFSTTRFIKRRRAAHWWEGVSPGDSEASSAQSDCLNINWKCPLFGRTLSFRQFAYFVLFYPPPIPHCVGLIRPDYIKKYTNYNQKKGNLDSAGRHPPLSPLFSERVQTVWGQPGNCSTAGKKKYESPWAGAQSPANRSFAATAHTQKHTQ